MLGMEMMVSNLIGMKPDEIKTAISRTMQLIENAAKAMEELQVTQKRIEEKLDILIEAKEAKNGTRKRIPGNQCNDSEHVQL